MLSVLILCTGNSARSQMAEGLLRSFTSGRVRVQSAGSAPQADVHPMAIATMRAKYGIDITTHAPKHVGRFLHEPWDFVITVCDQAAEVCPVFPASTERIHWSFRDPAAAQGGDADRQRTFDRTASEIARRLRLWLSLPAINARVSAET